MAAFTEHIFPRLLKPSKKVTKQASANWEVFSYIIPAVATSQLHLSMREKDVGMQTLRDE